MQDAQQIIDWLTRLAPQILCGKCGDPVEFIDLQRSPILESWLFEFRCHGKKQHLRVSYLLLKVGEIVSFVAFASPKRRKVSSPVASRA